jgi:peroxiredoxin
MMPAGGVALDRFITTEAIAIALLLGRVVLAGVFVFAGLAKLANRTESDRALAAFGVPAFLVRPVGVILPALELGVAALLLPAQSAWWGAVGASVLLLTFIVAIAANLAKGRAPACQCFGQVHARPISIATLVRNVALVLCAAPNVWVGRRYAGLTVFGSVPVALGLSPWAWITFVVLCLGLALQMFLLWQLFRQHGRVLVRMDALEQRLATGGGPMHAAEPQAPLGLAIGAPAPSFKLPTLSGATLGLDTLLRESKTLLLVFSNPGCQPCASLLPDIKRWQREAAEMVKIAVVSGGSAQANRVMSEQYALHDVLLQQEREVAELYAVPGTPGAVLIRADGTIGSFVAMGGAAIATLFATATGSLVGGAQARSIASVQ